MDCNSGVYKITRRVDGKEDKVYVGSSTNIKRRWKTHFGTLKNGTHKNLHLQRSYDQYGDECFFYEIIECVSPNKKDLMQAEQYWMDFYESYNIEKGYNVSPSAYTTLGFKYSQETKELFSKQRKGKKRGEENPFYGKKHTKESLEKMREIKKGKTLSLETKEKMSKRRKGEGSWHSKLTNDDVIEIVKRVKNGETIKGVSKDYCVTRQTISSILKGKNWAHITGGTVVRSGFSPCKTSIDDINNIRKRYDEGEKISSILADYSGKLSEVTIRRIAKRETFKNL